MGKDLSKKYGAIENLGRSNWAITNGFDWNTVIDPKDVIQVMNDYKSRNKDVSVDVQQTIQESEESKDEIIEEWRQQALNILPFGFERLAQRILRECGFVQVEVTKKTGDGGIGKLKINGIFSFHVAFQCKRYSGSVGSSEIRNFRTDIEKGIFITTGFFTKVAKEEASNPGKKQIDLIDGEFLISILAVHKIGVHEKITYEIDEKFFLSI